MKKVQLGRTGLYVTRTSFGALPIQRLSFEQAKVILRKAYDSGINFFDTARGYSDSEEKIGYALSDVRENIIIATKSPAKTSEGLIDDVYTSLEKLKTDYIDILQLHNPSQLPDPNEPDGLYSALKKVQAKGLVKYIGITNHKYSLAQEAVCSGLYDVLQFPLSSLSSNEDLALVEECNKHDVGFIAMKALAGGLITNAATSFAFLRQFPNVVPIWGIQREFELDEIIEFEHNPPLLDTEMQAAIEKDREELAGSFCRGCGYCLPCPVGIPIPMAARMSLLMHRAPYQRFLEDEWQEKMELITECIDCGHCRDNCPYELDTPNLLRDELKKYRDFAKLYT